MSTNEHPLSWEALGRIVLLGLGLLLAWKAISVLIAILIALMIASAVFPFVRILQKRMPLLLATILTFVLIIIPFVLFSVFLAPRLVSEIPLLISTFHQLISNATWLPASIRTFNPMTYFTQNSGSLLSSTETVAYGIVSVITVFFLSFYFVLDNERFLNFFLDLFPHREHKRVKDTLMEVARVNGLYIRGNVLISIICACWLFTVLTILGVPFALPLAIFAGIMDLLPLVGGTLGAIPAMIIGFTISPLTGTLVIILHLLYQQIENVLISPTVYHKALDISPALSFISVVIGGGLFGILGAFLALPIAASLPAVVKYFRHYQKDVYSH